MSALARLAPPVCRQLLTGRAIVAAPVTRTYAYWNKDWRPGQFPKTSEERAAAAKRYGLRPEDYEPYPDDGFGYGDYPKLPLKTEACRDPYDDWDMPAIKRNFGEPVHVDADFNKEGYFAPDHKDRYSTLTMLSTLCGIVGSISLAYYLLLEYPSHHAALPKQFPTAGKAHYTFEPAE